MNIELNKDECYELEKLLDLQRTQLVQLANQVAYNLIIAEAHEDKNKEVIVRLKEHFELINNSIDKNLLTTKVFERAR